MKNQHPNIKHKQISMLDFALYQSKIVMVILWILGMLILFPIVSRAQVVRINIDIPSKMGLIGSIMPFELNDSRIDSNTVVGLLYKF